MDAASALCIGRLDVVVMAEASEVMQRNAQRRARVCALVAHAGNALDGIVADFVHEYFSLEA